MHPLPHCNFVFPGPFAANWFQLARVKPRLLFRMTGRAGFDGRIAVRIFLDVSLVAFDTAGLILCIRASGNAVIGLFHIHSAAFARGIRMAGFLVTGNALGDGLDSRVLVGVMAILAALRIVRFDVSSVIEIFDHAPLVMLSPVRTFLRIAQPHNARRAGFAVAA